MTDPRRCPRCGASNNPNTAELTNHTTLRAEPGGTPSSWYPELPGRRLTLACRDCRGAYTWNDIADGVVRAGDELPARPSVDQPRAHSSRFGSDARHRPDDDRPHVHIRVPLDGPQRAAGRDGGLERPVVRSTGRGGTGVRGALAYVLLVVFLAGCGTSGPPAPTPLATPTPVAACTTADGRPVVEVMQQYGRAWDDAVAVADHSPRIALRGPLGQLQRIRREVESQAWPACAQPAQQLFVDAMSAHIDGLVGFTEQRSGYEAEIGRGGDLLQDFRAEIARMAGEPAPTPRPMADRTAAAVSVTASMASVETAIAAPPAPAVLPTSEPAAATGLARPGPSSGGPALIVRGTGASGLIVRRAPGGERVASANEGERLLDLGQRHQADGREWRRVRAPDGVEGWAASDFLAER